MKKKILAFVLLGMSASLAGCGNSASSPASTKKSEEKKDSVASTANSQTGPSNKEEEGSKDFYMESELTDLDGIAGSGISGSASGLDLIQASKEAHGGYFISFTHRKGFALTYNFQSDSAKEASFALGLGNELGVGMKFTDESLTVNLNGTNLSFADFTVFVTGYHEYAAGKATLVQGANTLVVTVAQENEYCNGSTGGPTFDYVKVTSDSNLSWTPKTSNLPDEE